MNSRYLVLVAMLCIAIPLAAAQSASGMNFRGGATLDVTFLSQDPDPVEPGSYVDLRWKVENLGTEDLENVQFVLDTEYPFLLNDQKDQVKVLGDVGTKQAGDDSIILHWRLRVDENALEGNNEVRLSYFIDDVGVKLSPFPINIKTRQALLAVDQVVVDPPNPSPGSLANVTITLHNVVDTSVQDVKVKLDLTTTDLAPVGSTSEKVIDRISGGTQVTIPFTLAIDANAVAKVHQVPLRVEYANRFGDTFALNTSFGFRVAAASDYLVNLEQTEVYTADSKGKVTLSISNIGKSDLNFVTVDLTPTAEYRLLSAPQSYIGNLESDDFETAEFTVFVPKTKSGSIALTGNVRFKDAYNQERVDPFTIPLPLYTSSEAKRMGLTTSGSGGMIFLLLALMALGIVEWRRGWRDLHWLKARFHPAAPVSHEEQKRKR